MVFGVVIGLVVLAVGALALTLADGDDPVAGEAAPVASEGESSSPDTWRLGYGGFGPIKLGMTVAEASRAAGRLLSVNDNCGSAYFDDLDGIGILLGTENRILSISASAPEIHTISGAHVGMTETELRSIYPGVREATGMYSSPILRITSADGAVVDFYLQVHGEDPTVGAILIGASEQDAEALSPCD